MIPAILLRIHARLFDAEIEDRRDDEEEYKGGELHVETNEEDVLAHLLLAVLGDEGAAAALDHEGEEVAADEDFGDPGGADEGEVCGIDEENDAPVDHVDCGGVERGREQDEEQLDNIGGEVCGVVDGHETEDVADTHH